MPIEETDTKVTLTHPSDPSSSVTILKHGATILSWLHKGKEQLWLSDAAKLDGSKPVRGGIPLVFPIFGKEKNESSPAFQLSQHGFARSSPWEFLGQTTESPATIQFGLGPEQVDPEVYKLWGEGKYDFTLILSITLDDDLTTTIEVENSGKEDFDFKWLFHTYLRVPDITDVLVNNLIDQRCYDQLLATEYVEKAPVISFHEEFDRIYKNIPVEKSFQVIDKGQVLHNVHRDNLPDTVVWNPWIEKSKGMADFEPKSGYHHMLCIEAGHVAEYLTLAKGSKWKAAQTLSVGGEIRLQTNIF
ncbi:galactose mutarotase-like protein [Suhomyces tanzawaensis NRRL Y-17324]|uniref:Glucose-6-phosphate 1-epimerase n=1 Tax=Suhomyces tanzawaensis NRRL Y-17324 TaxID=984487 RepID=A0A1E4SH43_9ASCO|nr:galactose mutarotase-like protein [Suhomyces tanzawaensis NRRL Y-17324]ODV78828.1 galactose mutarotase-like protein [Suhomyces tanzawaensis NRRL Y-17324]